MKHWHEGPFAIPTLLAISTCAGLIAALFGDGWFDVPAWIALGLSALLGVRSLLPSRKSR